VADPLAATMRWRPSGVLFDAVYDPWPTPLARSAAAAGLRVVSGLDLLLAQAVRQFELFTGVAAPVGAMREALHDAAAHR
jgi:shikimate dehydrogenase